MEEELIFHIANLLNLLILHFLYSLGYSVIYKYSFYFFLWKLGAFGFVFFLRCRARPYITMSRHEKISLSLIFRQEKSFRLIVVFAESFKMPNISSNAILLTPICCLYRGVLNPMRHFCPFVQLIVNCSGLAFIVVHFIHWFFSDVKPTLHFLG